MPFGVFTFSTLGITILALGAGDVGVYTTTGNFAPNYYYKLLEVRAALYGPSEAALASFGISMDCTLTENGVAKKRFPLFNQSGTVSAGAVGGVQTLNPGTANDFAAYFAPQPMESGLFSDIIDASQGLSQFQSVVVDPNPTTPAVSIRWYIRFLMYTVLQGRSAPVWEQINSGN